MAPPWVKDRSACYRDAALYVPRWFEMIETVGSLTLAMKHFFVMYSSNMIDSANKKKIKLTAQYLGQNSAQLLSCSAPYVGSGCVCRSTAL